MPTLTISEARDVLTDAGIAYTRADYMNNVVGHEAYYSQFATPAVVRLVEWYIGVDAIKASTDPYFNDIPLHEWDALGTIPSSRLMALSNMFTQDHATAVPSISPSDSVCTFKAAARLIKARA